MVGCAKCAACPGGAVIRYSCPHRQTISVSMLISVRVGRSHVMQGARRYGAAASVGVDNKTANRGRCGRKGTQQLLSIFRTHIVLLVIFGKGCHAMPRRPAQLCVPTPFPLRGRRHSRTAGSEKALGVQAGATVSWHPASPCPSDSRRRLATGLANGADGGITGCRSRQRDRLFRFERGCFTHDFSSLNNLSKVCS